MLEDGRIFRGEAYGATGHRARRGGVLHRHDRLPGDPDRPLLPPPDRGADRAADRQHRLERRGRRVRAASRSPATWCATPSRIAVELALAPVAGRRAARRRAWSGSRASTPGRWCGTCASGARCGPGCSPATRWRADAELVERVRRQPADGRRRPVRRGDHPRALRRAGRGGEAVHGGRARRRDQVQHPADAGRARHRDPRAARGHHDRAIEELGARTGCSCPTGPATRPPRTARSR